MNLHWPKLASRTHIMNRNCYSHRNNVFFFVFVFFFKSVSEINLFSTQHFKRKKTYLLCVYVMGLYLSLGNRESIGSRKLVTSKCVGKPGTII